MSFKEAMHELKHHSPFTAIATLIGIVLVIAVQFIFNQNYSKEFFEVIHPLHIIVSGMATAGIFYKYKKSFSQALVVGIFGAIIVGTISDVILPYLGGTILTLKTAFHLPLFEKPVLILSSAIVGSLMGISIKTTRMPHLIHVFLSVFASLFYILAFSPVFNPILLVGAFLIVFIAVVIPCCMSDIVFPFFFLGKRIKTCSC